MSRSFVALVTALSLACQSCAPTAEQLRAVDQLKDAVCTVVRVFELSPTATELCVTEDELRQAIAHIYQSRYAAESRPGGALSGMAGVRLVLPPGRTLSTLGQGSTTPASSR